MRSTPGSDKPNASSRPLHTRAAHWNILRVSQDHLLFPKLDGFHREKLSSLAHLDISSDLEAPCERPEKLLAAERAYLDHG